MPFFIVLFFYITISVYQISAVTEALKFIFMVQSTFLEGILFIISLFLTFTPFLGPVLGIVGATFVWEWNILFSVFLFFWPYLIGFLFLSFRKKNSVSSNSKNISSDIEDAQIIEEEKLK